MDEQQVAADIRIFDAESRLGRVRYFAYPLLISLMTLPVDIAAGVLSAMHMPVLSVLLTVLTYIFSITMSFVFMVRRLHDLNASGWWSLLYAAFFIAIIGAIIRRGEGVMLPIVLLIFLIVFIFGLVLLFTPGTQGVNKFGPPPPPNSTGIVVCAWVLGLIFPLAIIGILAAIAIPAYQDYIARSQTSEGIRLAGGAEVGVSEYYQQNKAWPDKLESVYAAAAQSPAGRYVDNVSGHSAGPQTYGVVSTMKSAGVNRMIAGKSLEIWTTDGGNTWHCGPGGMDPVEPKFLPASCRDSDAP